MSDNLPDKLYECHGEVIVVHDGRALVHIQDGNKICYCCKQVCQKEDLLPGDRVQINARLVPECMEEIPYTCRALWREENKVPAHLFPRTLEAFTIDELVEYRKHVPLLKEKIPTELEKFLSTANFEALGSLLAMQGIIETAPLMKKPEKKLVNISSSSEEEEEEKEEVRKKKKKKDKKRKKDKKKKKKKRKRKHCSEDEESERKQTIIKKKPRKDAVDIPHHLVLHKLNDMIEELEREVKPGLTGGSGGGAGTSSNQSDPSTTSKESRVISYPKVGVAYDPKQINAWSNMRGFQNPAKASNWLGLTVAPGAIPTPLALPEVKIPISGETTANEYGTKGDEASPRRASLFQDIFGEERPPSPEPEECELPTQAFFRRTEPEVLEIKAQKYVPKSNNLSRALQSRLNRRTISVEERKQEGKRTRSDSRESKPKRRQDSGSRSRSREKLDYRRTIEREEENKRVQKNFKDYEQSNLMSSDTSDKYKKYGRETEMSRDSVEKSSKLRRARLKSADSEKSSRDSSGDRNMSKSPEENSRNRKKKKKDAKKSKDVSRSRSRSRERKSIKKDMKQKRSVSKDRKKKKKKERDRSVKKEVEDDEPKLKNMHRRHNKPESRVRGEKKSKTRSASRPKDKIKMDYSDDEPDSSDSKQSYGKQEDDARHNEEIGSDQENEEKMIEKIRKKRAKILAQIPEKELKLETAKPTWFETAAAKDNRVPITCFQQDSDGLNEVKKYKTVILCGSVLNDGQYSQLYQLSALVHGQSNSYFQACFPKILSKSNSLSIGSRNELMDAMGLKSSKFDVSQEGMLNVCYKHPSLGTVKTVSEKDMLLGFLNFLKGLNEPVVIFLHYTDSLLPVLLAKLNKYKLFDHFCDMVLYCCDIIGLSWSLHLDHLWIGKHYPSLSTIAESLDGGVQTSVSDMDSSTVLLGGVLSQMMASNHLGMQKVLEMSNKMNLLEYMSVKYSMIQGVKVEEEISALPQYIELVQSHDAWGVRSRVDLVWILLETIKQKWRGEIKCIPEKRATPLPTPELHDGEDQVTIIQPAPVSGFGSEESNLKLRARQLIAASAQRKWGTKTYNVFLSPGEFILEGKSTLTLELRVPALQLRINQLRGKLALLEGSPDFTLCDLKESVCVVQQSDSNLFPCVEATLRNLSYHPVKLSSETVTYPIATLRLQET